MLGLCLGHVWTMIGIFSDYVLIVGPYLGHARTMLGPCLVQFGSYLSHVWAMLGSFLNHVRAMFGPCLDHVSAMFGLGALTYMLWYIASNSYYLDTAIYLVVEGWGRSVSYRSRLLWYGRPILHLNGLAHRFPWVNLFWCVQIHMKIRIA
jgi:hypothetical protein